MSTKLFEAALGIQAPWFITGIQFDEQASQLRIQVDFPPGTRFAHRDGGTAAHPVYDTELKRFRHLNFFQHECVLEVRVPRVRLANGSVRVVDPPWAGQLPGFTLLFEALILALCQQMPFAAVARLVGLSWHRVHAIATRYVALAVASQDLRAVRHLAIDETSRARGHQYLTLAADAEARRVIAVVPERDAAAITGVAQWLEGQGGDPQAIEQVSIDMLPAYEEGVATEFPNATVTYDKFHVVAHATEVLDETRRLEQRTAPDLKGMRWILLKDRRALTRAEQGSLDQLLNRLRSRRTARAWQYRATLRELLSCRQINVCGPPCGAGVPRCCDRPSNR